MKIFLILWREVCEPQRLFQCANCKQRFSSCISPRISDDSSPIHSDSLHTCLIKQLKQLNSVEILIYFIFNMIQCRYRSTWLARWKVDRSTPQSDRTLSVDWPLFQALVTKLDLLQINALFHEVLTQWKIYIINENIIINDNIVITQ